jgi:hypothetical protein
MALAELWSFLANCKEEPNVGQVLGRFKDTSPQAFIEAALASPAYGKNADFEASKTEIEAYFERIRVETDDAKSRSLVVGADPANLTDEQRRDLLEGLQRKQELTENLDREGRSKH